MFPMDGPFLKDDADQSIAARGVKLHFADSWLQMVLKMVMMVISVVLVVVVVVVMLVMIMMGGAELQFADWYRLAVW